MNKGLTLPNTQWRAYTDPEVAAINDLAPDTLIVLVYGDQQQAEAARYGVVADYLAQHPSARFIIRAYEPDIATRDATAWADECWARVEDWQIRDRLPELIPANEFNIEGMGEDWPRQVKWLKEFATRWREIAPHVPLHLPALSPSGDWATGLWEYHKAGIDVLFDRIDVHAYGPQAAVIVSVASTILLGPIDVTEFNQIDPAVFFAAEPPCHSATWFILGGTSDQSVYDILTQPSYYASFKAMRNTPSTGGNVADFTSPNHDGPRAQTLGVVIHATLGGSASPQTEYDATINWFESTASQVSAHAVAGPGGKVHRSVRPENIAWHCRTSNATHLGIELAKAHVGDVILPEILDAAAKVVAGWCKDYSIPVVWSTTHGLAEHREMPTNTDGHQDVGGPFDRADFLARVKKYATEDQLTDQQKAAVLDDLGLIWGMAKADTIKANPAESERAIHERVVAIKVALGING